MAVRNVELLHECFPKHLRMGTTSMKEDKETEDKETEEEGKQKIMDIERTIIIIIIIVSSLIALINKTMSIPGE